MATLKAGVCLTIPEPRAAHFALQCLLHVEGGEQHRLVTHHEAVEAVSCEILTTLFVLIDFSARTDRSILNEMMISIQHVKFWKE